MAAAAAGAGAGAPATAGAAAAQQLVIPAATFTVVEYPGYVRDAPRALAALGGEAAVPAAAPSSKAAAAAQDALRLSLRPDQPQAHPLFAYPKPTRALLLRISRPRGAAAPAGDATAPQAQQQQPSVRLEGVVRTTLHFRGLADYQYLTAPSLASPGPSAAAAALRTAKQAQGGAPPVGAKVQQAPGAPLPPQCAPASAEPSGVAQPLLCVPLLFSKLDAPLLDFPWRNAASGVAAPAATGAAADSTAATASVQGRARGHSQGPYERPGQGHQGKRLPSHASPQATRQSGAAPSPPQGQLQQAAPPARAPWAWTW